MKKLLILSLFVLGLAFGFAQHANYQAPPDDMALTMVLDLEPMVEAAPAVSVPLAEVQTMNTELEQTGGDTPFLAVIRFVLALAIWGIATIRNQTKINPFVKDLRRKSQNMSNGFNPFKTEILIT